MFGVKQAENKDVIWNSYYISKIFIICWVVLLTNVCFCQILWENGQVKLSLTMWTSE